MIDEKNLLDAIDHCEEVARRKYAEGMLCHANPNDDKLNKCIECAKEHEQLAEWLRELLERRKVGEWIPVSERLPEEGVDVLVWFEYFRYGSYNKLYQTAGISYIYDGKWSMFVNGQSGWNQLSIIAWMSLPEPYKQE